MDYEKLEKVLQEGGLSLRGAFLDPRWRPPTLRRLADREAEVCRRLLTLLMISTTLSGCSSLPLPVCRTGVEVKIKICAAED